MVSIVVLTYNQLEECTKPCIDSLYRYTERNDFELIVVDNDSKDGTPEYLRSIVSHHDNMRVILNSVNKGYAAGNNDGIKVAKGDFIILLNNDTLVSPGWLDQILSPLHSDESVGMVGPVSNSVGNEQRINIEGLDESNYVERAADYIIDNSSVLTETQRLGFYCVALRKSAIDKVGLLDEKFGIGMFEDDDYCMRFTQAGYKLVITDGCFIYHKGSVSFKKLAAEEYMDIFNRNKQYFFEKHKVEWCLSDISFAYWYKFNNDLNEFMDTGSLAPINRIHVRFENFKHLLFQMRETELSKNNIVKPAHNPLVSNTKWAIRRENLKNELIYGNMGRKKKYIRMVLRKLSIKALGFIKKKENITLNSELDAALKSIKAIVDSRKIMLIPPTVDYYYMKQRPQHLAEGLALKGFCVIYVTLNHKTDKVTYFEQINENLMLLNEGLLAYLNHIFSKKDITYYCMWPTNRKYLHNIAHSYLVYDYMDELDLLDHDQTELKQYHDYLLEYANLITVSSLKLYGSIPDKYHNKILLLRNAVDDNFIAEVNKDCGTPNEIRLMKISYDKIVGYYGAIAPWIDFDVIEHLLMECPSYAFVFIGPIFDVEEQVEGLKKKYDNIFFIREMERNLLIPYLKSFDICIIPFIKNSITDSVSPVKIYEYISALKPVVATDILECKEMSLLNIATNKKEYAVKIRLTEALDINIAEEFIASNRWETRVDEIVNFIEKDKS